MKKIWVIIGVGVVILLGVLIFFANKYNEARGPEQTFVFYNSLDKEISVTFHKQKKDKSYGGYLDNIIVKPGETKYELCPRGIYKINIWNGNVEEDKTETLRSFSDVKITLADNKDNYNPIYIDATGDNYFAVVDVNFIYSGSSLANSLSQSLNTARTKPVVKLLRNGRSPFRLPDFYEKGTFIKPSDKLPKKISYGTIVYALVPFPNTIKSQAELSGYINQFIQTHLDD
jgi:hypothetical protein